MEYAYQLPTHNTAPVHVARAWGDTKHPFVTFRFSHFAFSTYFRLRPKYVEKAKCEKEVSQAAKLCELIRQECGSDEKSIFYHDNIQVSTLYVITTLYLNIENWCIFKIKKEMYTNIFRLLYGVLYKY